MSDYNLKEQTVTNEYVNTIFGGNTLNHHTSNEMENEAYENVESVHSQYDCFEVNKKDSIRTLSSCIPEVKSAGTESKRRNQRTDLTVRNNNLWKVLTVFLGIISAGLIIGILILLTSARQHYVSTCVNSYCQNGGSCFDLDQKRSCLCKYGFYGTQCEYESCDTIINTDPVDSMCLTMYQDISDDRNWTTIAGRMGTDDTGPSSSFYGKYYHYFGTTFDDSAGDVARIYTKHIVFENSSCLRFWYHMNGANMGTLNVLLNNNMVWNKSGNQNNRWHSAYIDIAASPSFKITFEAVKGSGNGSKIAIDNIKLSGSPC